MRQFHLDAIRNFEGYTERGVWDYKQVSNGYGTRAKYAGEVIDRAEADRRFKAEIDEAHAAVQKFAPQLDEGTAAALTSLTFNAGSAWMRSGLGAAVKAGDLDTARQIFKQYTIAGGKSLPGLEARRVAEAEWIGGGSGPARDSAASGPRLSVASVAETGAAGGPLPSVARAAVAAGVPTDTLMPLAQPHATSSVADATEPARAGGLTAARVPERPVAVSYDMFVLDMMLARSRRPEADSREDDRKTVV